MSFRQERRSTDAEVVRHRLIGRAGVVVTALVLALVGAASPAADISYVYDDAGRLLAVIDPTTDTAIYAYL